MSEIVLILGVALVVAVLLFFLLMYGGRRETRHSKRCDSVEGATRGQRRPRRPRRGLKVPRRYENKSMS